MEDDRLHHFLPVESPQVQEEREERSMNRADRRVRAQHRYRHLQCLQVGCRKRKPLTCFMNDSKKRIAVRRRQQGVASFIGASREPIELRARQVVANSHEVARGEQLLIRVLGSTIFIVSQRGVVYRSRGARWGVVACVVHSGEVGGAADLGLREALSLPDANEA